jgi:cytoskeletal protein RodZ
MSVLGDFLKEKREAKKITIDLIASRTAVRKEYLEMLEEGNYEALPSYVHAHGFLSHYCKVVGLDFAGEIKPMFEAECDKHTFGKTPEELLIEQHSREKSGSSPIKVIAIVVAIAVLALIVVVAASRDSGASSKVSQPIVTPTPPLSEPAPATAPEPVTTAVSAEPLADTAAVTEIEEPVAADTAVATEPVAPRSALLRFTDTCWVNLNIDNVTTADFMAESGQERVVEFSKYFRINIGNASAIAVSYDNRSYTGFGGFRQPVRNLYFVVDDNGTMSQTRVQP